MNNYKKALEIVNNSKFSVKGVKTFIGREGYGVNANLYYNNKKVAFLLDSGNGGCLDIDWTIITKNNKPIYPELVQQAKKYLDDIIISLPYTTWNELGEDYIQSEDQYKYDDEAVCNMLIDTVIKKQDYQKILKNIVLFDKNSKKIVRYKAKKSSLNEKFRTENGIQTGREYFGNIGIVLNDLPKTEAFNYLDKYL